MTQTLQNRVSVSSYIHHMKKIFIPLLIGSALITVGFGLKVAVIVAAVLPLTIVASGEGPKTYYKDQTLALIQKAVQELNFDVYKDAQLLECTVNVKTHVYKLIGSQEVKSHEVLKVEGSEAIKSILFPTAAMSPLLQSA